MKDAQRLAGAEQLDAAAYRGLSDKGRAVLQQLLVGGVFQLIDPSEMYDAEDEDDGEDAVVLGEVVEAVTASTRSTPTRCPTMSTP